MTAGIGFDPAERDAIAAEVNISVLKRSDTAIKCVLKSANHVCLYHLGEDHQWRRLDVEGSLFIVERHLDHQNNPNRHMHRIVIINRKSLNNYTDNIIIGNKHLELSDQMIMYSNSKNDIIGIWFYEKAQAHQIFDLLQRLTNDDNAQSASDQSHANQAPKRPAKPADPAPSNRTSTPATAGQSRSDNSLERFFPNLKLTNGVAGHQVPQNAKGSLLESQAVSTMSTSPKVQKVATAFKPTAEIDEAIITASEAGIPESAAGSSTTMDVKVLASQARQVVRGNPRPDPNRKVAARPRPGPKPMPTYNSNYRSNSHSPVKMNGSAKTISPPRSKPAPRQPPSARPSPQPVPRQPLSTRPNQQPAPRQPISTRPNQQPAPRQPISTRPNQQPAPRQPLSMRPNQQPVPRQPASTRPNQQPVPRQPLSMRPNQQPAPRQPLSMRPNQQPAPRQPASTRPSPQPVPRQSPSVRPNQQPAPRQPLSTRPNQQPAPRQPASTRPNPLPEPRQPPSARPNSSTGASTRGLPYPQNNPTAKQQKQPSKPSPPSKRTSAGKVGYSVRGNGTNRQHVVERPVATSIRAQVLSKSGSEADDVVSRGRRAPQVQLLTKPKPAVDPKPVARGERSARGLIATDNVPAPPELAVPVASATQNAEEINSGDLKPQASVSSSDAQPSTPNVPIPVEVPGAPRAKQGEKQMNGGSTESNTNSPAGSNVGNLENGGASPIKMAKPLSEEEVMRQMQSMSMRQGQGNLKIKEAHMLGMQAPFPFVAGDLGLGQVGGMLGGGLSGPGGGGVSGFAPSLHPQMALMMQQQQQHLFMQQQLMAQHHQRQMQLQAEHTAQAKGEAIGKGISGDVKTKEESANDLMRMLNVERRDGKNGVQKSDEQKNAEGMGASIAKAEKHGELGTNGDKLDKGTFRAVVQRMLTDRKLFEGVYGHYLRYDGE